FAAADSGAIVYCMGVTQHTCGTENVVALANLSLLTGNLGKPHAGMYPLRGQNNVQGACDMGCLPNVFSGYQPVHSDRGTGTYWQRLKKAQQPQPEDNTCQEETITGIEFEHPVPVDSISDAVRAKFSKAWNVELSDVPGRTIAEMFHDNPSRRCKVIYIMGENPIISNPHSDHVRGVLENMDFVVVQDIFLTETAKYADVILPAATFAEKDGSFINTERRVQLIRRAIKPRGQSKPDWEIIQALAQKFNLNWNYSSPEEIWDEVRELTPHYFRGMTYERLEKGGLQWPCPAIDHPGTPILHKGKFARGIGQFSTVEYRPLAADSTDKEYPFILTTARKLYHYHTRTMTGKTDGLNYFLNEERMEISPQDAETLSLTSNDKVKVTSRRGSLETKIQITDRVPPGIICMSFHFAESAVNILTDPAVCNMSVVSGLKVSAVR
ncbi:formate dehydrogenase major subunit, partial [Candidatus Hakubella thermalkaliphila]